MKRIGIFAATRWECAAVQRALHVESIQRSAGYRGFRVIRGQRGSCEVLLVQTGIGPIKAQVACQAVCRDHTPDLVMSSGLACALTPASIGDLYIGTEVLTARSADAGEPGAVVHCDGGHVDTALQAAREAALPVRTGRFMSLPRIIWRAEDKRRVARETGALALDMESGAIGETAAEAGIPFAIVRAASDLLDEDLPIDFNLFLNRADWLAAAWACATRPANLLQLIRLRRQMYTALRAITTVCERFLDRPA